MTNKKTDPKIKELESRILELEDGWKRTQADFVNFKRKAEEDRTYLIKNASTGIISDLLPVLDNFSLAAKHIPENIAEDNWVSGVKVIEKQFESILKDNGLEKIESVGQPFDHNLHEALESVTSDEPEGIVTEEISPGYILNSEMIRPAKVKVSKGK